MRAEMVCRACVLREAEAKLRAAVEGMCPHHRDASAMALEVIKAVMHKDISDETGYPNDTVEGCLCRLESSSTFNNAAMTGFPEVFREFDAVLRDLPGLAGKRKRDMRRFVENTWKQDDAAIERINKQEDAGDFSKTPYRKARKYHPAVVLAFSHAISSLSEIDVIHTVIHDDIEDEPHSPEFSVLIAAIHWAHVAVWSVAARPAAPCPAEPKPEGIVTLLRNLEKTAH